MAVYFHVMADARPPFRRRDAARASRSRPVRRARARDTAGGRSEARAAAAYGRLHALIVGGALAPGSPLVESDVCARLGVSRTPVRAGLLRLQQEGLVCGPAAGRGGRAVVAPLTSADLREIFLMVGALEATAARRAAALAPPVRERLAAVLDEANAAWSAAMRDRPPDLAGGLRAHLRLHAACVDAAAGPRLRAELVPLAYQAERYQRVYSAAMIYAADEFAAAHQAIVAAIRAGDAESAERAVEADWRVSAERFDQIIGMLGERGNW